MTRDAAAVDALNAHTPWDALRAPLTPPAAFFTRSNFEVPRIDRRTWRLAVEGGSLSFDELASLPSREIEVVLECAGNGRSRLRPPVEGTPWEDRAVGCARFRGASFADAARAAGHAEPRGVEVVFAGADHGKGMRFERSLPLDVAMRSDVLVAYEMDGAPLTPEHGHPARLLVPGWYGVASVKWLASARFTDEPFRGHFQVERYVYERAPGSPDAVPVREMRVKSLVTEPQRDVAVGASVVVRGWAWSGRDRVVRVEVTTDGGASWHDAALGPDRGVRSWRAFSLEWRPARPGPARVASRAHDASGAAQPDEPEWNVHGYGNNAVVWRDALVHNA
jgi:DMSO/TMAO reductase YedYZ molybdopterin-dependent catalytic subunit